MMDFLNWYTVNPGLGTWLMILIGVFVVTICAVLRR
jgi:hypothetical protein